jgi:hypothetical protein
MSDLLSRDSAAFSGVLLTIYDTTESMMEKQREVDKSSPRSIDIRSAHSCNYHHFLEILLAQMGWNGNVRTSAYVFTLER